MGEATSGTLYLVDGFVEAGALGMVWGPSSGFKTFIALDWALCISSGTPWHGRPVTQGPVLYIAGEGQRGIQKRIEAWKKANNVDDIGEFYVSTGAINARDPSRRRRDHQDREGGRRAPGGHPDRHAGAELRRRRREQHPGHGRAAGRLRPDAGAAPWGHHGAGAPLKEGRQRLSGRERIAQRDGL